MRHPTIGPANDDDSEPEWDPTSPDLLRSQSGRENPVPQPFFFFGGTRHPRLVDITDYLAEPEQGSIRLPATIPLLGSADASPIDRSAVYGVDLTLPNLRRATHLLALGVSGSGKNVNVIDPLRASAIEDPGQTVVSFSLKALDHGPVRELCRRAGRRMVTVNLGNPNRSVFWNPLQTDDPNIAHDLIRRFADAARNPLSHDSEFWTQWTRTGLEGCWEAGLRSFPLMLGFFSRPYGEVIENLRAHGNASSGRLADFLAGGSHNAETVTASILGVLNSMLTASALEVLSEDELRLDRLFRRPVCLHVEISEPRLETEAALVRMLARCIIDALIEVAEASGRKRIPATVFIDDLPSLGALLSVERLLTLRSREIGVVAGVQSIAALALAYGPVAPALLEAFAHKIVLPGCSQPCAEYFSHCSGETFVSLPGDERSAPVVSSRRLLSSADIRSPQCEHGLLGPPASLFFGAHSFQAYLQRFHEIPRYASVLRAVFHVTGKEKLRRKPRPTPKPGIDARGKARRPGWPTFTDTTGWSVSRISAHLATLRDHIGWSETTGDARAWWQALEARNRRRSAAILRLAEELRERQATIAELFEAYESADTENLLAILHYMDYQRQRRASAPRHRRSPSKSPDDGSAGDDSWGGTGDAVDDVPF